MGASRRAHAAAGHYLNPQQDPVGGFFDFRSNVIYNWGDRQAGYNSDPGSRVTYNFVDNSYWTGPDSKGEMIFADRNPFSRGWFAGNSLNGRIPGDGFTHVASGRRDFRLSGAFAMPPVARDPAASAYERVLARAGASLVRDTVDQRVVASVRNRSGRLIDSQRDVGGWPVLARGTPGRDTDGDGMPDAWEQERRLNPRDPRDGNVPGMPTATATPMSRNG